MINRLFDVTADYLRFTFLSMGLAALAFGGVSAAHRSPAAFFVGCVSLSVPIAMWLRIGSLARKRARTRVPLVGRAMSHALHDLYPPTFRADTSLALLARRRSVLEERMEEILLREKAIAEALEKMTADAALSGFPVGEGTDTERRERLREALEATGALLVHAASADPNEASRGAWLMLEYDYNAIRYTVERKLSTDAVVDDGVFALTLGVLRVVRRHAKLIQNAETDKGASRRSPSH
jgi:hypothetical protein